MKIVQINALCSSGSTGAICSAVSDLLTEKGVENYILYCLGDSGHPCGIKYTDLRAIKRASIESRILGNWGFEGKHSAKKLIRKLEEINPDIIHLHNIHSHAVNLDLLFEFIRERNIKVYWTFHDCWAFTGYCMHFDYIGCEKWKNGCSSCPQKSMYSWIFDRSKILYNKKRELLSGIDLTIITPSKWMAGLVSRSFLSEYPVKIINNGIDLGVFRPVESDFRKKYNITSKYIVLGVSFNWNERKGIDVFSALSKRLGSGYSIVLVGADESVSANLPHEIICISRLADKEALAKIYSAADVFVNPTREDTFPTVNIESLACGTPVVTFKTGGSPEIINNDCGIAVDRDDTEAVANAVKEMCSKSASMREACVKRACGYEMKEKFEEYTNLYL